MALDTGLAEYAAIVVINQNVHRYLGHIPSEFPAIDKYLES